MKREAIAENRALLSQYFEGSAGFCVIKPDSALKSGDEKREVQGEKEIKDSIDSIVYYRSHVFYGLQRQP